jgi:hypothetical protein
MRYHTDWRSNGLERNWGMITSLQQEFEAREHFHPKQALIVSLVIGALYLILSHGFPWSSPAEPDSVMGRRVPGVLATEEWTPKIVVAAAHMVLAMIYGSVICGLVYRSTIWSAVALGALIGFAFYLPNYLLFRTILNWPAPGSEFFPIITHLGFGIFVAAGPALETVTE